MEKFIGILKMQNVKIKLKAKITKIIKKSCR